MKCACSVWGGRYLSFFPNVYMYTQLHACMVPSSSYAKLMFLWMSYTFVWFGLVSSPSPPSSSFARSHSLVRFHLFVQFHHCSSVSENNNQAAISKNSNSTCTQPHCHYQPGILQLLEMDFPWTFQMNLRFFVCKMRLTHQYGISRMFAQSPYWEKQ